MYRHHLIRKISVLCTIVFLSGSLHAIGDSSRVYKFIEQWRSFLAEDDVNCHYLESCYADTVRFYNERVSKTGMCVRVTMLPGMTENLLETGYSLEKISDVQWKAVFESANNMYGIDQFHYLIVEEYAENEFLITVQSSIADDRWFAHKNQIATNTITSKGKTYYVLDEDSTTLQGTRLYLLTDTLKFSEPWGYGICMDENSIGYFTSGNIYAAMSRNNRRDISVITDLSPQLNCDTFQGAESMQKGFCCFGVIDSVGPGRTFFKWVTPEYQWMKVGDDIAKLQVSSPFNYGDECWTVLTTVHVLVKKKKIVVGRMVGIRPRAEDED